MQRPPAKRAPIAEGDWRSARPRAEVRGELGESSPPGLRQEPSTSSVTAPLGSERPLTAPPVTGTLAPAAGAPPFVI